MVITMTEERRTVVHLAGNEQACPCHVCGFFSSKEEEYRVMLPFMAEGFRAGDKLFHIIDKRDRDERLARLKGAGIDVEAAERNGQLELRPWERAHLAEGRFDRRAMLRLLEHHAVDAQGGHRTVRCWSNQEWVFEDSRVSVEDLLEYEGQFNRIWPTYNNVYVCV
jgi:hypothetical protein